jgi:hypothetical protein
VPGLRHRIPSACSAAPPASTKACAPGELIPPHTHAHEDQCIYVVSGTVHLRVGGELIQAPAGGPMSSSHAAQPPSSSTATASTSATSQNWRQRQAASARTDQSALCGTAGAAPGSYSRTERRFGMLVRL